MNLQTPSDSPQENDCWCCLVWPAETPKLCVHLWVHCVRNNLGTCVRCRDSDHALPRRCERDSVNVYVAIRKIAGNSFRESVEPRSCQKIIIQNNLLNVSIVLTWNYWSSWNDWRFVCVYGWVCLFVWMWVVCAFVIPMTITSAKIIWMINDNLF